MFEDSVQAVVLAYNEEGTLREVLERTHRVLSGNFGKFEVLVYDDGSTDSTPSIAEGFSSTHPSVRVIHNPRNMGIGHLLRRSYMESSYDWTVIICSDMQFDPYDLKLFFPYLKDYDIVISSRQNRQDAAMRKYISALDRLLLKVLFSASFADLHWIKFVRKSALDKERIMASSPFIEIEILLRARKNGARMKEITVPHYPRTHGVAKGASLKNILSSVKDMFSLYFRL